MPVSFQELSVRDESFDKYGTDRVLYEHTYSLLYKDDPLNKQFDEHTSPQNFLLLRHFLERSLVRDDPG